MKSISIRWRLTIWYAGVVSVILIAFGVLLLAMTQRHLTSRTDAELDEEMSELELEIRLAENRTDMLDLLRKHFYEHEIFELQVGTATGEPIFLSRKLAGQPLKQPRNMTGLARKEFVEQTHPTLGSLRVNSRFVDGPEGRLVAQSAISLAENRRELHSLMMLLLTVGPLGTVASLAGGYLLARKALSPVDRLTREAAEFTAEHLDRRLKVPPRDDELARLARTLNNMLDRLACSVDEMRRFTADAAHELRTPLAVLRTEMEVCLRAPRTPENYRRTIATMLDQIERLGCLTDQLLQLCRQECGESSAEFEEVRLDALLRDVVDRFRTFAETKHIDLQLGDLSCWRVHGHDGQLGRLLHNLVDNAIKYTPEGGRVAIGGESAGESVRITIEDTGIGIADEHLPHICKRFYRAEPSRNRKLGGTGLGLAICSAIAGTHDGRIEIESKLGRGTRVTLVLPLENETESDDELPEPQRDEPATVA